MVHHCFAFVPTCTAVIPSSINLRWPRRKIVCEGQVRYAPRFASGFRAAGSFASSGAPRASHGQFSRTCFHSAFGMTRADDVVESLSRRVPSTSFCTRAAQGSSQKAVRPARFTFSPSARMARSSVASRPSMRTARLRLSSLSRTRASSLSDSPSRAGGGGGASAAAAAAARASASRRASASASRRRRSACASASRRAFASASARASACAARTRARSAEASFSMAMAWARAAALSRFARSFVAAADAAPTSLRSQA